MFRKEAQLIQNRLLLLLRLLQGLMLQTHITLFGTNPVLRHNSSSTARTHCSLSGSIKPWKMTGSCAQWWTRLCLAKCKNCLQVKSAPVFNKQLHSMAPQRPVWRCKISSTARTIDSVNFMLEMISLMASFSKTHCERWRLLVLTRKSLLTIYLGCVCVCVYNKILQEEFGKQQYFPN